MLDHSTQDSRQLIATFVIAQGAYLLHSDHDFDPFVRYLGLPVVT